MSAFTPASELLLRHSDEFTRRQLLFAGDLQDSLPASFPGVTRRVHTQQFHRWQTLSQAMGAANACYGLLADASSTSEVDTLVYYWPKNKSEAQFQLMDLLAQLTTDCDIFIVGENRSGVRSAETILADYCSLHKIDSARRCSLYYGKLTQRPIFNLDDYWHSYLFNQCTIKTLPGVFSQDKLDAGSRLLISTFTADLSGNILDMGCGCGVLAAALASVSPQAQLTLCDVSAVALTASAATLAANELYGNIIASNVYSDIDGQYAAIIANPPFHQGLQTSLQATRQLIRQAPHRLQPGGELRIVANGFLPYPDLLDETFGSHQILARSASFKVYQARC